MKFLRLACSHANQVLRCTKHATKSHELAFTGDDQRLSEDKIYNACSSIRAPIVIRKEFAAALPDLAGFLSESHNIGHGAHRAQSKVQTLLQVHAKALRNKQLHGDSKWELVARDIERARPFLSGQIRQMTGVAQNYSGGGQPTFLHEPKHYAKTLDTVRDVGGTTFAVLGFAKLHQVPKLVIAMMKASMRAPEQHLRGNGVRLFTSPDAAAAESGKIRTVAFDAVGERAAAHHLKTRNVTDCHVEAKLIGDLGAKLVMHVFGKKARGRPTHASVGAIMREFVVDLKRSWPSAAGTPDPRSCPDDQNESTATATSADFVQHDASAGAAPVMRAGALQFKSFEVGALVKSARGGDLGERTIEHIGGQAKPAPPDSGASGAKRRKPGPDSIAISASKLADDFEVIKTAEATTITAHQEKALQLINMDCALERARSTFRVALHAAHSERADTVNASILFSKGAKTCISNEKCDKGGLALAPLTPTIGAGPRATPNAVVCSDTMADGKSIMYLVPKVVMPPPHGWARIVPFWNVPTAVDTALVNMAASAIKAPVEVRNSISSFSESTSSCQTVHIPVLVNIKPLSKGTELYQKSSAAPAKPQAKAASS
ncbi:unnamed protein product, partial [Prorocentrum cordatum]